MQGEEGEWGRGEVGALLAVWKTFHAKDTLISLTKQKEFFFFFNLSISNWDLISII
jgi:hypothetical protein